MAQMTELVKLIRNTKTAIIIQTPCLQRCRGKCEHKKRYVRFKKDLNQTSRDEKRSNV